MPHRSASRLDCVARLALGNLVEHMEVGGKVGNLDGGGDYRSVLLEAEAPVEGVALGIAAAVHRVS